MSVNIHGRQYVTVAERVTQAHKVCESITIITECMGHNPVLFKATVTTPKGTFTGWSAADPKKSIERATPYEVAETSAVGRALAFAGFESVESIASADEMSKGGYGTEREEEPITSQQVGRINQAYKKGFITAEEMKTVLEMTKSEGSALIETAIKRARDSQVPTNADDAMNAITGA